MNLWVKRTGQLLFLAVALFFLSCKDDVSELGYRNPNSKFNVKYIEIPLGSSVFLTDSVRTAIVGAETPRILVGDYDDPAFGNIQSTGYTQIGPQRFTDKTITDSVSFYIYDSAAVELQFDNYSYGGPSSTKESFTIHEIVEALDPYTGYKYYSNTEVPYVTDNIGHNSFVVDGKKFKKQFDESSKDTTLLHITINDPDYGQTLWNLTKIPSTTENNVDFDSIFFAQVTGLAIAPASNNKVVGFNIASPWSRVILYFHVSGKTKARTFSFGLGGIRYSNIKTNFTGDLATLLSDYEEVTPATKRYLQQGTRVITKVDMSNFYTFADSVDKMIINSCELAITSVEDNEVDYYHIPSIGFVAMSDFQVNRYHKSHYRYDSIISNGIFMGFQKNLADSLVEHVAAYQGFINDINGVFSGMDDSKQNPVFLQWNGTGYSAYMTLLAQHFSTRDSSDRYQYFALFPSVPSSPQKEKSVNRIVFNKDNLRLKIYYTTPKEPEQ